MENQWPLPSIVSMATESQWTNAALLEAQRNVDPCFAGFANVTSCSLSSHLLPVRKVFRDCHTVVRNRCYSFPLHFTRAVQWPLGALEQN